MSNFGTKSCLYNCGNECGGECLPFKETITTKIKYPILGYAPGHYLNGCHICNGNFMGDKYSTMCEPCAINKLNESHSLLLTKNKNYENGILKKLKEIKDELNKLDLNKYE